MGTRLPVPGWTAKVPVNAPRLGGARRPAARDGDPIAQGLLDEPPNLGLGAGSPREGLQVRVLGGQGRERHAEQRVRSGRERAKTDTPDRDLEVDLDALGPSDPLALGSLGRLGPVQAVQAVEELFRVRRDPEEHWAMIRCTTRVPQRSQRSPSSCSLARTVRQDGHHTTGASCRTASPARNSRTKIRRVQR